jgi:hypothetical protein
MPRSKKEPKPPAAKLTYAGWRIYHDCGDVYRHWTFREPHAATGAAKGDSLDDMGPGANRRRFRIRAHADDWKVIEGYNTQDEVNAALGVTLAPWPRRPPRDDEVRTLESLRAIAKKIEELASATRQASAGSRTLADVRKAAPDAQQQNEHLKLVREDTYRGGEAYRDWELLRDAPGIRALKGDILREEDDGDLTPFCLKRAGRDIGSPEWWQVRHLFAGLETWSGGKVECDAEPEPAPAVDDPAVRKLRRAMPYSGPAGDASRRPSYIALEATAAIPAAGIVAGDLLMYSTQAPRKGHVIRARMERVPRNLFGTIAEAPGLRFVENTYFRGDEHGLEYVRKLLRRAARNNRLLSASDASSPLRILRVPMEQVIEPVHALSDDGAIFELLCDVGCRLPRA